MHAPVVAWRHRHRTSNSRPPPTRCHMGRACDMVKTISTRTVAYIAFTEVALAILLRIQDFNCFEEFLALQGLKFAATSQAGPGPSFSPRTSHSIGASRSLDMNDQEEFSFLRHFADNFTCVCPEYTQVASCPSFDV